MSKQTGVSFQYENFLKYDGRLLRADVLQFESRFTPVNPEKLHQILTLGHQAIEGQIEMIYARISRVHPNASKAAIWVAQLSGPENSEINEVYSPAVAGQPNTSLLTAMNHVREEFHPHWQAAEHAGFAAEVDHVSMGGSHGAWLRVRLPE